MRRLRPGGTAVHRWLSEPGTSDAASGSSSEGSDIEDLEPGYLGWELARCAPGLSPAERHALAGLAAACVASMLAGSTRLPIDGPSFDLALASMGAKDSSSTVRRLLDRARLPTVGEPVAEVIGRPGDRTPLIVDGAWVYLERMLVLEERFCDRVRALVARAREAPEPRAVRRAVAAVSAGARPLTREQMRAVHHGLVSPLALVSGALGTGKTMTVVALVRAAIWMGTPADAVAIAAPTGKAAQRLSEALSVGLASCVGDIAQEALRLNPPVPVTLHRLLGWSPTAGRFVHHEGHPLTHRMVIVDEASMIDLAMMDRLLRALPERGHVVLVGDADQLPSVEAGAVFRDLCAALDGVRLTTNLRVASDAGARNIVTLTEAVNAGDLPASMATCRRVDELTFEGVAHLDARWSEVGDLFLERWWRSRIVADDGFLARIPRTYRRQGSDFEPADERDLRALAATYGAARLLVATRSSGAPACADAINQSLLGRLPAVETGPWSPERGPHTLSQGAPVLVQRNDYTRGLFNGDQGVLARVSHGDDDPRSMLVLMRGGRLEAFPIGTHTSVAPAFAMTVHKAQGSEFDHVALVLPDADHALLTRELVYTAITRARRTVVIVGPRDVLARAIARTGLRSSGVAARLSG